MKPAFSLQFLICLLLLPLQWATAQTLFDQGRSLSLPPEAPVLFVTHSSNFYNSSSKVRQSILNVVSVFEKRSWPIIYLNDLTNKSIASNLPEKFQKTQVNSLSGEHSVPLKSRHIFVVGGYFAACALRTMIDAIRESSYNNFKDGRYLPIHLYLVEDALYLDTKEKTFLNLSLNSSDWSHLLKKYPLDQVSLASWNSPHSTHNKRPIYFDGQVYLSENQNSKDSTLDIQNHNDISVIIHRFNSAQKIPKNL